VDKENVEYSVMKNGFIPFSGKMTESEVIMVSEMYDTEKQVSHIFHSCGK
jgi:hypothetical protein